MDPIRLLVMAFVVTGVAVLVTDYFLMRDLQDKDPVTFGAIGSPRLLSPTPKFFSFVIRGEYKTALKNPTLLRGFRWLRGVAIITYSVWAIGLAIALFRYGNT